MHELTLAREIVAIVQMAAQNQNIHHIRRVRVELGAFGHVEEKALQFAFTAAVNGTLATGSLLEISRLPGQAWCYDCNKTVALSTRLAPCPLCGGEKLDVIGGNELRVVDMEVE